MRARPFTLIVTSAWAALLALGIAALSAKPVAAQPVRESQKVLLLFTHSSDQAAQVILEQAMRSTLQAGSAIPLEIYSEYLDAVRTPLEDFEKEMAGQFQRKYSDKKFDLIFAVNPPALKFLLSNRAVLFPDIPIVYIVLDRHNLEGLNLGSKVTGVWGGVNYKSDLEIALALHPGTKQVVVISGVGEWDRYWRGVVQEELRDLEGSVEINYLIGLTISELKQALAGVPPHTVVLFVSSTQDKAGNNPGNLEVVRRVSPASSAPIYGSSDAQLGLGIVGGELISFEALGVGGAQVGLRVLAGESPEAIAPHIIPSVPMFDWRELKRWDINEDHLPSGSIVRFKEFGFWERYKGRIIVVLLLFALQASLIAVLLIERRRRQRARQALDQLNAALELRVSQRTAALDGKTKELEAFTYSVAHDLKAPLRGIDGYSRLLLEDHLSKLDDEGQTFLRRICDSTELMRRLIDDLLAYAHVERCEMAARRIELKPFLQRLIQERSADVSERGIDLTLNVNGGAALADESGLAQALRNYLDNAIKFTRDSAAPRIEVGAEESGGHWRLWVRDNGTGFDPKYQEQIFEIFQRLHHSEEYAGTGIGLAIARIAAERMGGRVWAESEPGNGATFYLEIPSHTGEPTAHSDRETV